LAPGLELELELESEPESGPGLEPVSEKAVQGSAAAPGAESSWCSR